MSVPKSKPSHCFDHSTDQNSGRCHGCTAVPNGHGSFQPPIASVFRVYGPTGTRSRRCQARFLRDTCRLNTSESKVRVRTPAFGLPIGRFISASPRPNAKRKLYLRPAKNNFAKLTPRRFCRYFSHDDARLVAARIGQGNVKVAILFCP
jgi:hypothetical protein